LIVLFQLGLAKAKGNFFVDADDNLFRGADFRLTSACPLSDLKASRSAPLPQAVQFEVSWNNNSRDV
jgi:hypothetical protein